MIKIFFKKIYLLIMFLFIFMFFAALIETIFVDKKTFDAMVGLGIMTMFLVIIYILFLRDDSHNSYTGSKIVFFNPNTKAIKEAPLGFSWRVLLFGFFVPLSRGDWKWGVIMFVLEFLTSGLSRLVFLFIYNRLYIKDLIALGFRAKYLTQYDKDLLSAELNMVIPMLEAEEKTQSIQSLKTGSKASKYIELNECPNCSASKVIKVNGRYMCAYCNSTRYISDK